MIEQIYLETEIADHPDAKRLQKRFPKAAVIPCTRYSEVFNRHAQNFRLQKRKPALILARKHVNHVLPTPPGYGIGGQHNYYFSHMLNCLYDCRYCFLQGMFRSANYLLFLNFEDFMLSIEQTIHRHRNEEVYFFSGYDCDSLALEGLTHFAERFLPFFKQHPQAFLELRTKSVCTAPFMQLEPIANVVIAYSLSPAQVAIEQEHGAPPIAARLSAMKQLAKMGWKIGLRFDPIIYHAKFKDRYAELFRNVFDGLDHAAVHSVSFGPMRFPKPMHDSIVKLYPQEKLFAAPLQLKNGMVSYPSMIEAEMMRYCKQALQQYVTADCFLGCLPEDTLK